MNNIIIRHKLRFHSLDKKIYHRKYFIGTCRSNIVLQEQAGRLLFPTVAIYGLLEPVIMADPNHLRHVRVNNDIVNWYGSMPESRFI